MEKSMWAAYQEERGMATVLERDYGFIAYSIQNRECFIQDIYITPERRKTGRWAAFINDLSAVALDLDCNRMTLTIPIKANGANLSLKCALGYGFEVTAVSGDVLLLAKWIKG